MPYWLDSPLRPPAMPPLTEATQADLVVVGGGYQGLWTAIKAKERDPGRDVLLLDADRVGGAASGRNGGFVSASLTHGIGQAVSRWPDHVSTLERLGLANLDGFVADLAAYGVDCGLERTGKLAVATTSAQLRELEQTQRLLNAHGHDVSLLGADEVSKRVSSPRFVGGTFDADAAALVDPARLAWGLLAHCRRLGVRVHEHSPAASMRTTASGLRLTTPTGSVDAGRAVLATNAFPALLRRLRLYTVPVYDYVLVTEPLDAGQRESIGWSGREGVTDAGNQFHYFRLTADDRVLWGGYDAVYHFRSRLGPALDQRPDTFSALAEQLVDTFGGLADVGFSHAWGGAIDTCTRFFAFYGTALRGRVSYAMGHTGLGVGATRFAAETSLDLVDGLDTERTRLPIVAQRPLPFPPEPLRWAGIQATRWSLARADARDGRRNAWLRTLDRFGVGFDS